MSDDGHAAPHDPDERGTVGLTGFGTYVPPQVVTGEEIAEQSGIPASVVVEKMGVRKKHVCPSGDDHVTDMSVQAGRAALDDAGLAPEDLDLVLYHGSEYKDYIVWSAAANVADRLGAENAYAHETYALCAGAPIAIRQVAAQLRVGDVDNALLVAASREEDLVDYENENSSFMFNFGSGASAMVLEAAPDDPRAVVRESAAITDGSFSMDVVMPAGGSVNPPTDDSVDPADHSLHVPDPDGMKERLADVSAPAFLDVADEALSASGYDRNDLDFVALTHMKRSFHDYLTDKLDVGDSHYYLDDYGHVQSVDQVLALEEGLDRGLLEPGDVVLFLAAGTGYTWTASVLEWRG